MICGRMDVISIVQFVIMLRGNVPQGQRFHLPAAINFLVYRCIIFMNFIKSYFSSFKT